MKKSKLGLGLIALLVLGLVGAGVKVSYNTVTAGGDNGNVIVVDDKDNNGDVTIGTGVGDWVTINDLEYGPSLSARLNFARGATTTPGGLFKILNAGSDKICDYVELNISKASSIGGATGAGGSLSFAVSTSTAATAVSTKSGTVVASSTIPTSTTGLISSVINPGTYVNGDQDVGGASWLWSKGTYLIGAFDDAAASVDGGADFATSSDVYSGMTGKVYVRCHVQ